MAESVNAPMVGKVLRVESKAGDRVQEDDVLFVLEAMKMEIPVVSPRAGVIKEIKVAAGDSVEADALLAIID